MKAIHPQVEALMRAGQAAGAPPLGSLPPVQARLAYTESRRKMAPPLEDVALVENLRLPGPAGEIGARFYRGLHAATPAPCLLFLHGGGWVIGDLDSHEAICRRLATRGDCCVLSVDYRLAPEHPFPAAVDDGAAALRWLVAQADRLGVDPKRLAVGGDSAGGNLAASIALMARDGDLPALQYQMLLYPATDLTMSADGYRRTTAEVPLTLTPGSMRYFVDHYVPSAEQRVDWRASPLRAASVAGTPPALVLTCGHDPLCDEGRLYAERLEREGVPVTALHLSDYVHGMLNMGKFVSATAVVLDFAAGMMRDVLSGEGAKTVG